MKQKLSNLWGKDGTKSVLASLISILIGMVVGALIIIIVGAANPSLGLNSAWEGIRLVFGGLFSTGRDAAGTLTFGFNSTNLGNMLFRATPLILTGLSVAVAFKTGLFNIGAPGQYLMGTAATLILALTIPTETVPAPLVCSLPSWAGHAGRRPVGLYPRTGEGLPQHQRGAGLHHDQLDRRQPGDLAVRQGQPV